MPFSIRVFAALGSDSARIRKVPDPDGNKTVAEVISKKTDHEFLYVSSYNYKVYRVYRDEKSRKRYPLVTYRYPERWRI
jgi:hypothetical protein